MSDDIYESEVMVQTMPRHPHVDFYIQNLPEPRKNVFNVLREKLHEWVPGLKESLQYRIPTFSSMATLCAMASHKKYIGFYFANTELLASNKHSFAHLSVGQSCVRLQTLEDVPMHSFELIIKQSAELVRRFAAS